MHDLGAWEALGWTVAAAGLALAAFAAAARASARRAEEALLAPFAARLAHDVRNPLAAVKGAAQVVAEDLRRDAGGAAARPREMTRVLLDQVARLERTFARYERLARGRLERGSVRLDALARELVAERSAAGGGAIATELGPLPACRADREMLAAALECLLDGAVRVATRARGRAQILSVAYDGAGAPDAERAVALAFVARVARAHGGRVARRTRAGCGTLIELRIPARR